MSLSILRFELRHHLRNPMTAGYFLLLTALMFTLFIALGGAFKGGSSAFGDSAREWINSHYAVYRWISMINLLTIIIAAAYMGQAALKDYSRGTYPLIFTTPIRPAGYLLGRFTAAYITVCLIALGLGAGTFAATQMPFVATHYFQPCHPAAYLRPYLISVFPNLFIVGAIFFIIATHTRRMFAVYAAAVVLIIAYSIATEWLDTLDNLRWAALLDPFGYGAEELASRYWTIAEKNSRLIPFSGFLRLNRILWTGLAAGGVTASILSFRFTQPLHRSSRRESPAAETRPGEPRPAADLFSLAPGFPFTSFLSTTGLYIRDTVFRPGFLVILGSGILFVITMATTTGTLMGTPILPVTYVCIGYLGASFNLFVFIIITCFSGELIWRERDLRINGITDATAAPDALTILAKLSALWIIVAGMMAALLACYILVQAAQGYFRFELDQYLLNFFVIKMVTYSQFIALAFLIHILVNRKFPAYLILLVLYLVPGISQQFGVEHFALRLFRTPPMMYSDLAGYGNAGPPFILFSIYWSALALILTVLTYLFRIRGMDTAWRTRLILAVQRLRPPAGRLLAAGMAVFALAGLMILVHTMIINRYTSSRTSRQRLVRYETEYRHWEDRLQPRIREVDLWMDLYPEQRRVVARGKYLLENPHSTPVSKLFMQFPGHLSASPESREGIIPPARVHHMAVGRRFTVTHADPDLGIWVLSLDPPLPAGGRETFLFDAELACHGVPNGVFSNRLVLNGTFIHQDMIMPEIGYQTRLELDSERYRQAYDLPHRPRMTPLTDPGARDHPFLSRNADRILFQAVISVPDDQIAVTPGTLQATVTRNGRTWYRYSEDQPIWNYFAVLAGKYAVTRDRWNDVAIEIYHLPRHTRNLDRMILAVKDSLDYCSRAFGPYQYRELKIIEFPRFLSFAESFPNTIPFTEQGGFIADIDTSDPLAVDYAYYTTAHEMAHQWWGHQMCPADVEGAGLTTETLACYTSLMILKHRFGDAVTEKILRYEQDMYLAGRKRERMEEVPLCRTTGDQPYIHYQKGVLVMMSLQDFLGEDTVNRALARFLAESMAAVPPYPVSTDLIRCLRDAAPEHDRYLIHDMFETITMHEWTADSAGTRPDGQGGWMTEIRVSACKLRLDGLGNPEQIAGNDRVDIVCYDRDRNILYNTKHRIPTPGGIIRVHTGDQPVWVSVDPFHRYIDRNPSDNTVSVQLAPLESSSAHTVFTGGLYEGHF